MLLKGKNIILTGGGRGIGRIIAKKCNEEGANLALISRTKEELKKTISLFSNKSTALFYCFDVSDNLSVTLNINDIIDSFNGRVDILINNAGVQLPIGSFADIDLPDWVTNIKINLFGVAYLIYAVLPVMIGLKHGKMINFSGGGSVYPRPNFSSYSISKTGIVRFTEILAKELAIYNIDVNAVSPGAINTKMIDEVIDSGIKAGKKEYDFALKIKNSGGDDPALIANLICFLASDLSNGITGKLISAIWDPWENKEFRESLRIDENIATLRRIDNKYFRSI